MWSVVVVLPAVQAEFGVARGEASLPYTLTMLGFGFGGVLPWARSPTAIGVAVTSAIGAVALGLGYVGAAYAGSIWQFALDPGRADRLSRRVGDLRAARCRHLALVRAPARHRGRDLRLRQLSLGHAVAAGACSISSRAPAGARRMSASACSASRRCCRWRSPSAASRPEQHAPEPPPAPAAARPALAGARAGAPHRRRLCLLRRDVDAAGAHRRLLRRPRLRRRPRRRDAVDHARPRHRQPGRLGLPRRPHRRACDGARRLRSARRWRCCSTSSSTGSPRST